MANPGMSSWVALQFRAKFVAGESVLILGANGLGGTACGADCEAAGCATRGCGGRNPGAGVVEGVGGGRGDPARTVARCAGGAFRSEIVDHGVDVVLDYLWAAPAESMLAAIAQKGLKSMPRRGFAYGQIGQMAGATITLAGATLPVPVLNCWEADSAARR